MRYFRLLGLILVYGRLRSGPNDFYRLKKEGLRHLSPFMPPEAGSSKPSWYQKLKATLWKNSVFKRMLSEAAFLKNTIYKKGGHLHAPMLNLSYIRIPKSASTSLSFTMLRSIYKDLGEEHLTLTEINFLADGNMKQSVINERSSTFFTVVRNPFARIVSVYRDMFEEEHDQFIYEDYLFGILQKKISFREFLIRIDAIPDKLKDQHFKPQYLFLEYYKKRHHDVKVLKLEQAEAIRSFLSGFHTMLPFLNKSAEPNDYKNYFDDETVGLVSKIYREDIKTFCYGPEAQILKDFVIETDRMKGSLPPFSSPKSGFDK